jgi:hypothetical protein
MLGAKAGSLAISDDGEVSMVLGLGSDLGISMGMEREYPSIKIQACRQEREIEYIRTARPPHRSNILLLHPESSSHPLRVPSLSSPPWSPWALCLLYRVAS